MPFFLTPLARHAYLIWQMTKRDVVSRYKGSVLGLIWSFGRPIFMLAVYTIVFAVVFEVRWSGGELNEIAATDTATDDKLAFAVILFAGLIIHGLLSECLTRGPGLIVAQANLVRKVIFPLESLGYVLLGAALFHAGVSFVVMLAAHLAFLGLPPPTILLMPIVLLPLLPVCLGVVWLLSALGVYLRDIGEVSAILATVLLFMSPIFFPADRFPEAFQPYLALNPLSLIIENIRAVAIFGEMPDWHDLGIYGGVALIFAQLSFLWFQKARRGFADVL